MKAKRLYSRSVRVSDRHSENGIQAGQRPAFFCPPVNNRCLGDGSAVKSDRSRSAASVYRAVCSSIERRSLARGPVGSRSRRSAFALKLRLGLTFTALRSVGSGGMSLRKEANPESDPADVQADGMPRPRNSLDKRRANCANRRRSSRYTVQTGER